MVQNNGGYMILYGMGAIIILCVLCLLNYMINIAFSSSFSSQIGLLAFLKSNELLLNYLIVIPSTEHKYNEYTCTFFQKDEKIKKVILVKSLYIKIIIIVFIDFLKVLSKFNLLNISIVSPRPFWLFSILGPIPVVNYFNKLFVINIACMEHKIRKKEVKL